MSDSCDQRSGVIAGGNWIVDHVKLLDSWPPQDTLSNIRAESSGNGGSPYNVLKGLAKLGATYPLEGIGLIGGDADGAIIMQDCQRHRIDTGQLRRLSGIATSYTDVMTVQSTGRRTFFHHRGANARLAPEHFDFSRTRAKFFHLGYMMLLDELDRLEAGVPRACTVFRNARAAGLFTSLDCVSENSDRFQAVVRPTLPEVDLLFANDLEAEKITGIELRRGGRIQIADVERAASDLLERGVRRWVVLHFPEAAYARGASGESHWQPSLEVPSTEIVGVAGAGDAMASGVLHGLHNGWQMPKSLRLGVGVAASSLLAATCSDGILSEAECLALEGRWKFRPLPVD